MIHELLCRIYARMRDSSFYRGFQWFVHGDIETRILRAIQFSQFAAAQNQKVFPQFKNKYAGRDVAVVACGPTASSYKPIPEVVHIGVNRAIFLERVDFDYLFVSDGGGAFSREHMDRLNSYRGDKCVKFYGYQRDDVGMISESDVIKAHAYRYAMDNYLWCMREYKSRFPLDISTQPLPAPVSTVFPALQFALWTNPKRIYLVGCDCTQDGHFYTTEKNLDLHIGNILQAYKDFASFAKRFYPDTQIISINPVGLKGMFEDCFC